MATLALAGACLKATEERPAEPLPPVSAAASVDKAVATTGDVITYSVVVEHDAKIKVEVPEAGAAIAGFRIIDTGTDPAVTKKGRTTVKRWYTLRADLVGSYILPPVVVRYREPEVPGTAPQGSAEKGNHPVIGREGPQGGEGSLRDTPPRTAAADDGGTTEKAPGTPAGAPTVTETESARDDSGIKTLSTSEIFVEVKSVLPKDGEAKDIRDLKPIIVPKKPVWPWVAGGAGLLLLMIGVGAVVWYRRRRRPIVVPPPPPHEVAYAALDALRNTDFANPEAVRQYFYALSEILRAYIEGRFALNATDLTTEEILPHIADLPLLASEQRGKLKEFLFATDLVKYAQHEPKKEEIEAAYDRALTFVETTTERPNEAQPNGAGLS
jgi:hypothetical protein